MRFASDGLDEDAARRYVAGQVGLFVLALAHALLFWPVRDALALFLGGIVVAFAFEVPAIRVGLFSHHLRPRVLGVPVSVLLAWPAVVYVSVRLAGLFVVGDVATAAVAAVLATLFDAVADPPAAAEGAWNYPDTAVSDPRFRGVPWWNFAGWLLVVFLTAMLPVWL